jgi:hypothetical protein
MDGFQHVVFRTQVFSLPVLSGAAKVRRIKPFAATQLPRFSGYYCCEGLLLAQIGPNLNKMDTAQQQSDGPTNGPFKVAGRLSAVQQIEMIVCLPGPQQPAATWWADQKVNKETRHFLGRWAPKSGGISHHIRFFQLLETCLLQLRIELLLIFTRNTVS